MKRIFQNLVFQEGVDLIERIEVLRHIGAGNSAVFEVMERVTLELLAMKEILIKDQQIYEQVKREIHLLGLISEIDQPFVVQMKSYMICQQIITNEYQQEPNRSAFIVMEKGQTSLANYLQIKIEQKQYININQIRKLIWSMISGFCFLQQQNIVHQDIKPENILLMDVAEFIVKICDIGSGLQINQAQQIHTIVGTLPFMAPEIVESLQNKRSECNMYKADVFSLGLCVLYAITQKKFQSRERRSLLPSVYKEIIQDWIKMANQITGQNPFIQKILQQMLIFDPTRRPDFQQLNTFMFVQEQQEHPLIIKEQDEHHLETTDKKAFRTLSLQKKPQHRLIKRQKDTNDKISIKSKQFELDQVLEIANSHHQRGQSRTFQDLKKTIKQLPPLNLQRTCSAKQQVQLFQSTNVKKNGQILSPIELKISSPMTPLDLKKASQSSFLIEGVKIIKISSSDDISLIKVDQESDLCVWFYADEKSNQNIDLSQFQQFLFKSQNCLFTFPTQMDNRIRLKIMVLQLFQMNVILLEFFRILIEQSNELKQFHIEITSDEPIYHMISSMLLSLLQIVQINIHVNTHCQNQEIEHKKICQIISRIQSATEVQMDFNGNNINFAKSQWFFNDKLRSLRLNYASNQIERSLNGLAISLADLINLQSLDIDLGSVNATEKDITFLMVQITKIQRLQMISLSLDGVKCISDKYIITFLSQLSKMSELQSVRLSLINTSITQQSVIGILSTYERISFGNQNLQFKNSFSLSITRIMSRADIIKFSINNKILLPYKIDFLSSNEECLQIVYLKQSAPLKSNHIHQCNRGLSINSSNMYDCLTCSDAFYLILGRPVVICDQCANTCHEYSEVHCILKPKLSKVQKHNFIAHRQNRHECDCYSLGICKIVVQSQCTSDESYQMAFSCSTCYNSNEDLICGWCKDNCHSNHSIQQFYPKQFSCACNDCDNDLLNVINGKYNQ